MKLTTRTYCDGDNPSKAIIALHGWTGDEFVFEPVAKMLNIKDAKYLFELLKDNSPEIVVELENNLREAHTGKY